MKKTVALSLAILSFASLAFGGTLATHTPTAAMAAVRGGTSQDNADNAQTPLIKFSTGVSGLVNFEEDSSNPGKSSGYVIAARHEKGSKNFLAVNDKTTIYWKQATVVTSSVPVATAMTTDIADSMWDAFAFENTGWTPY